MQNYQFKPSLQKQINRFSEEVNKDFSPDIAEIACNLIPELISEINKLNSLLINQQSK